MDIFVVISLLGGLALFLYGMNMLGTGLEKISGGRLEQILEKLTNNILTAVLLGAAVTAAVQSSSATTVIVVGLVNARMLKLRQAIGVIMGANIGTTITAHILRLTDITADSLLLKLLKPTTLAPMLAVVGILMFMLCKRSQQRDIGQLLLGFGILFTGMFQMEAAVRPLRELPAFSELFATLSNPILGVLAGALVTAIIQSSSASVGILQALSSTGAITYASAFPIIMGQNIGTCITPILASIGASRNAKRAAVVHLTFNILGTVVFLAATYAYQSLVGFSFWQDAIDKGGIANFHTIFNVVVTLLLIPFAGLLQKLACYVIKSDKLQEENPEMLLGLDDRLMISPGLAVEHSRNAVVRMSALAMENFNMVTRLVQNYDPKLVERIQENEFTLNKLEDRLEGYLLKLSQKELSDIESRDISEMLHSMWEFERIGDQIINIMENVQDIHNAGSGFSEKALNELDVLCKAVEEVLDMAARAYTNNDQQLALRIEPLEQVIDRLEDSLKTQHIARLRAGHCTVDVAFPFMEVLSNLEKISDNCSSLGVYIIGSYKEKIGESFDAHEYLHTIHRSQSGEYVGLYAEYRAKYFSLLPS